MNLYIGNLDYGMKEPQLREIFEQIGPVTSVKVISDKFTGRSKGFAFVEMADPASGQKAIEALNGKEINSRQVSVTEARPREERPRTFNRNEGGGDRGGYNRDR
jgi:RNA recognition motif-containing protein